MMFPLPGANWTYLHALTLKAATPLAGFALQDGTPGIISWAVPDDGKLHRFTYFASMSIGSDQDGGDVDVGWFAPDGSEQGFTVFSGGQGAGQNFSQTALGIICGPGTTVTIAQTTALTGGAATLWAEIWGL